MTRRCALNLTGFAATALIMLGIAFGLGGKPTKADTHSYASQRRQVKACVLVSNAASKTVVISGQNVIIPENDLPYVFYFMDRRSDFKPAGWEFVNPLAPATIAPDMIKRWTNRDTGGTDASLSGPLFKAGAPLTKNIGAYWEVNLDTVSQDDLQQFDIVLMAYTNNRTQFSPDEREKLRKFTDSGGTVWLEDEGGFDIFNGATHDNDQFFIPTRFTGALAGSATLATIHHPLVNFPYGITAVEVPNLGAAGVGTHHVAQDAVFGPIDARIMAPVIWSGPPGSLTPLVSAGDFGAGHVIISSAGIGTGINCYAGGTSVAGEGANSGAVSGEGALGVQITDLKFAYNLISWTSSVPTAAVSARRSGGTLENIGYQLGARWATVPPGMANTGVGSGAVVHKGVVFYVDGNNLLRAYDASPSQDLDNDGKADDGIADYINGSPYDEIWNVDLKTLGGIGGTTRISTPTIITVYKNNHPFDIVTITTDTGLTYAFDAFPVNGAGQLQTTSSTVWAGAASGTPSGGAGAFNLGGTLHDFNGSLLPGPSPALSEGVLFAVTYDNSLGDNNNAWRVDPVDPFDGTNVFDGALHGSLGVAPSPNALLPGINPGMANVMGPLTVGYVKDAYTGAQDKMIYATTAPPNNNLISGGGGGSVFGVWFQTKAEPMLEVTSTPPGYIPGGLMSLPLRTEYRATGERGRVPWFAPSLPFAGIQSLLPRLHKTTAAGVTTDLIYMTDFTVAFVVNPGGRDMIVHVNIPLNIGDTLTADYTLDWPGFAIANGTGGTTLVNAVDMNHMYSRRYSLYNPNGPLSTPLLMSGAPSMSRGDLLFVKAGDYFAGDRLIALHDQYNIGAAITGVPRISGTSVAWMFYPNGPNDEVGQVLGPNGYRARFENTDNFIPPPPVGPSIPPASLPLIVTDMEGVGTPAYADGIVYMTGYGHMKYPGNAAREFDATVIVALRAEPTMTFAVRDKTGGAYRIPNDGTLVSIQQLDLNLTRPNAPRYVTLRENQNFTVDRDTGTIHVNDARVSPNGEQLNNAVPFFVQAGNTTFPDAQANSDGYGILDNVLWWMIIPIPSGKQIHGPPLPGLPSDTAVVDPATGQVLDDIRPASGPTIIGDSLYYGTPASGNPLNPHGSIVSIDLRKMPSNGHQVNVFRDDGTLRMKVQPALRGANGMTIDQTIIHPPLGTTNMVVTGTPQGLVALDNQLTLIADHNRLIEVNAAGDAVWTMDSTQSTGIVGGAITGTGQIAAAKISLARPNVARRTTLNDFIVADTGNNRVIQLDKGGNVTWELHTINDGMRFLRSGDPLTLNHPTDLQTFTQIGNTSGGNPISYTSPVTGANYTFSGGYYYSVHYIVADSGNFRAMEIVDIYDQNGNPIVMTAAGQPNVTMLQQLVFVTRSGQEQNRNFRYRTIQEFLDPSNKLFMIAAVDNVKQGNLDVGVQDFGAPDDAAQAAGGSVVVIQRQAPPNDGLVTDVVNAISFVAGGVVTSRQPISSPTWFKEFESSVGGVAQPRYLLADANGCYVLNPQMIAGKSEAVVEWMLTADDYYFLTGRRLRAASITRLSQADYDPVTNKFYPHYLITNRYTGQDNIASSGLFGNPINVTDGNVSGEVVEVRSDIYYTSGYRNVAARLYVNNAGFLTANPNGAITWILPKEQISPVLQKPIKRSIGSIDGGTTSYLLEQPTFSDRPF